MERRESGGRQREQVGATVGAQGRLSGGQTGVWAGDTGELGPLSMHVGGGDAQHMLWRKIPWFSE